MALSLQLTDTLDPGETSAFVNITTGGQYIAVRFPSLGAAPVRKYGDLRVTRSATFTGVGAIAMLVDWMGVWLPHTAILVASSSGGPLVTFTLDSSYPEPLEVQLWRGS